MKTLLFSLLALLIYSNTGFAQSAGKVKGEAAFLFAYYPKKGMQTKFDNGYKRHLEWHRNQNDPLPWYGWYVITGNRIGMFVDGTFGISFEAFDNRVKPSEDAQHFRENVALYGDATYRKVFRLKPDLSTSTRLENWNPSANIEAYSISTIPGRESLFEETVQTLVAALRDKKSSNEFTIYQKLTGGSMSSYLMMVPHTGFAYYDSDSSVTTLSYLIKDTFEETEAEKLLNNLSKSIRNIHGETWSYRKDLSYFPKNN